MIRLAGFTGLPAQILKIFFMGLLDALLVSMFFSALNKNSFPLELVIAVVFIITNIVYFTKISKPLKFLIPGLLLLLIFVVVPVLYTIQMSGFNYRTGNEISKPAALQQILVNGLAPDVNNTTYDMVLGRENGKFSALLTEQVSRQVYIADAERVVKLLPGEYTANNLGVASGVPGFVALTAEETANMDAQIGQSKFPLSSTQFISPQAADVATLLKASVIYDKKSDTLKDLAIGVTYKDDGNGNFVDVNNPQHKIIPGWKAYNNFANYTHLFSDPNVRGPFMGVFIWTISFAFITVIMMFAVGLLLALALNRKIALRRFYRSIIILPYAIPGFMSILVWNGMFNRQFGAINSLFHLQTDWFNSPWLAKAVILIVNLWLGFPYFYLISSGALQAIPAELEEAAAIDGATPRQILRQIKLPLLLQILSPLLISSFAFNFNNFNIVYLLTGGGPTDVIHGKTAGATDILITYTYKTAFGSNEQNLGLASAISMVIFLFIGGLSLWSLRQSKILDQI